MHMNFRAAIAGVSGYAGGEIARLLTAHPDITLSIVTGASSAGNTLAQMHPNITGPQGALVIQDTTAQALGGVDVIFLPCHTDTPPDFPMSSHAQARQH